MQCASVFLLFCVLNVGECRSKADPYTYLLHPDHIDWPSKMVHNVYVTSHRFNASNIIPTRFQSYGLSAVLAFPRLKPGVPITLAKITLLANRRVPAIKPFPTWEMQEEGHPDAIQSAVDLYMDEKKILWVLDSGIASPTASIKPSPTGPRVLGINFITGKILHTISLRPFAGRDSQFQYVVAENGLGRPFVYVACSKTCTLLVFDVQKRKGKVLSLPKPKSPGDILYMIPLRPRGSEPHLLFSHLSYPQLVGVPISALRMGFLGQIKHLGEKTGQMIVLGTDNGSKMFFRWKNDHRIRMWDLVASDWVNASSISKHPAADPVWGLQMRRDSELYEPEGMEEPAWPQDGVDSGFARDPHVQPFQPERRVGDRSVVVGDDDPLRTSTHVATGSRHLVWSLESNFPDFMKGNVGSVGVSARLKPLFDTIR